VIVSTDEAAGAVSALRLVRTNGPFRLLWAARAVSFLGDALSLVALMLYVAETTGHALAVAMLLLAGDFAPALLGPLTGTISDRFDLKRVMVGCELAQAGLMVTIALWLPSLPPEQCQRRTGNLPGRHCGRAALHLGDPVDPDDQPVAFLVGGAGGLLTTLAVAAAFRHIARDPRSHPRLRRPR
jgi:MFS family permease